MKVNAKVVGYGPDPETTKALVNIIVEFERPRRNDDAHSHRAERGRRSRPQRTRHCKSKGLRAPIRRRPILRQSSNAVRREPRSPFALTAPPGGASLRMTSPILESFPYSSSTGTSLRSWATKCRRATPTTTMTRTKKMKRTRSGTIDRGDQRARRGRITVNGLNVTPCWGLVVSSSSTWRALQCDVVVLRGTEHEASFREHTEEINLFATRVTLSTSVETGLHERRLQRPVSTSHAGRGLPQGSPAGSLHECGEHARCRGDKSSQGFSPEAQARCDGCAALLEVAFGQIGNGDRQRPWCSLAFANAPQRLLPKTPEAARMNSP